MMELITCALRLVLLYTVYAKDVNPTAKGKPAYFKIHRMAQCL